MSNGRLQPEKLAIECFRENARAINHETEPQRYNLYRGLAAMAETIEELLHGQRKLQQQFSQLLSNQS
jgi:hypothetical protein